jgi:hypothetical protein
MTNHCGLSSSNVAARSKDYRPAKSLKNMKKTKSVQRLRPEPITGGAARREQTTAQLAANIIAGTHCAAEKCCIV